MEIVGTRDGFAQAPISEFCAALSRVHKTLAKSGGGGYGVAS
jgi:hypothetical protein